MKKYILSFFLLCIGFFIGHKYTLDKKTEFNSELITTCFMAMSKANTIKDFLHINVIHEDTIFKIKYSNTSDCINFEAFNIALIKFNKNTLDTFKIKISETIKPKEEIEISLYDFECDSIKILDYELISLNLSGNLK
tara:strand:- start:380 stop:790 length:411 start_codon:yes stop_codon:yes gene_type:complete